MGKKLRPMKLDSGRVVCPVCSKELSHAGWYQHPCYKRHEVITQDITHPAVTSPAPTPIQIPVKTWKMWIGVENVQLWANGEMNGKYIDRLIEHFSMLLRWRTEDNTSQNVEDGNHA